MSSTLGPIYGTYFNRDSSLQPIVILKYIGNEFLRGWYRFVNKSTVIDEEFALHMYQGMYQNVSNG